MKTIFKEIPTEPQENTIHMKLSIPGYPHKWYVMSAKQMSSGDYNCYGLVKFLDTEYGYFSYDEIIRLGGEVDTEWEPTPVEEVKV